MISQKNLLIIGGGVLIIAFIAIASWLYEGKGQMGWSQKKDVIKVQYRNMMDDRDTAPTTDSMMPGSTATSMPAQGATEPMMESGMSNKTDSKSLEMDLEQTVIEKEDFSDLGE